MDEPQIALYYANIPPPPARPTATTHYAERSLVDAAINGLAPSGKGWKRRREGNTTIWERGSHQICVTILDD